ncbi:hypothetical protein CWATWH8502_1052 [Crocosphaera watsonii WH 8502]|uniref:Uncharacterized protein n=3 Tax=Crocosphaera watsonii TaxID=263511 RepID=T2JVE7_CROWT|nr:hypothetical protein CWATWH8502_1052 [Crocosphaera watsonii WH 8502]CCQ54072.1 hypothetical protein CWATWH0005_4419 [Crocosphaera watsonii WH 0005]CCQ68986.1 hypothetical protein CWATWH0402_4586 [Crocosphaera watsonii WH 0402]
MYRIVMRYRCSVIKRISEFGVDLVIFATYRKIGFKTSPF